MASISDLTAGTKVRVTSRKGATGTVDGHSMDNAVNPPRPLVHIRFDGKRASYGLNYPEQCEIIGG